MVDNLDGEIWKDIIELDSLYKISNFGRVLAKSRVINTSKDLTKVRVTSECLKSIQDNGKGYKQLYVQINVVVLLHFST